MYASDVMPKMVVVTQPLPQVRAPVKFGEHPVDIVCSNCQNTVKWTSKVKCITINQCQYHRSLLEHRKPLVFYSG